MNFKLFLLKYILRKFHKFILIIIVLLGILVLLTVSRLLQKTDSVKNKFSLKLKTNCDEDYNCKINIIESLIKSSENDIQCKIPDLPIDNAEIMKFYHGDENQLSCAGNEDWIECDKSFCSLKESIQRKQGKITCIYSDIYRGSDNKIKLGPVRATSGNYTLRGSDFIKVVCQSSNGHGWSGLGVGIRAIPRGKRKTNLKLFNVLIIGFGSLSRNAFIRKLPKTYAYLTETLKTNILESYNIVGDGKQKSLIPILTGKNELELPETRRRIADSGYADLYPLIWKNYKKYGYVTSFNEDLPEHNIFTYRLNGFEVQPTDHYMKTLHLRAQKYRTKKYCVVNNMGHVVMLNYVKNFMASYQNIAPRFTFSFHSALSRDSINAIGSADKYLQQWLVNLNDQNLLENTILITMSDHGNRLTAVRNTLQGKQEERLPFFSFTFPKSFKTQYRTAYKNFQQNLQVLTTPYDIHETLLDILRLQHLNVTPTLNKHQQKTPPRGISLFQVIPKNRSCSMAYIEPHWCTCLKWSNLNRTDKFVKILAKNVVEAINNYTNYFRDICQIVSLSTINWIIKVAANEDLIRFKKSRDIDEFLADMSSEIEIKVDIYQIQITAVPGNSTFEATVTHNPGNNKFAVRISQIRRINRNIIQAHCIYNLYPDLRDYCYCKV